MENIMLRFKKSLSNEKQNDIAAERNEVVRQIRDTALRLENAYCRFEAEVNEDLIDSIIFEIQSLKALYRYLLKKAREMGAQCSEISVFGREVL